MRIPTTSQSRQYRLLRAIGGGEQIASNVIALKFKVKHEKGVKMSVQLQIEEKPGYLEVRFIGVGTAEDVWRQFELIAEHCNRANKNKLLLNFTEAREAYGKATLVDRYFLAERGQIFAHYKLIKVAGVDRPERIDPQKFGQLVAQNRGVNARAFTTVEDAEEWLLE